jgi:hypothetical protein
LIRCFIPFEYVEMRRAAASSIATVAIASVVAAAGFAKPCSSAFASTNAVPVNVS